MQAIPEDTGSSMPLYYSMAGVCAEDAGPTIP